MAYISGWNTNVWSPKVKLYSLLQPPLDISAVCVPDQSPFNIWFEPILHSHLSGNLTINGSWYTHVGVILSVPINRVHLCSKC